MGMAASQGRLLSLTARLHDVELQAQNLMAQKIALATQKDALYQDYCDALEATSINVAFWNDNGVGTNFEEANYSTLCSFNKNRVKQYALKDNRSGQMIVSEKIAETYEEYYNDKYIFAYAMMGFEGSFDWRDDGDSMAKSIGINQSLNYNYNEEADLEYAVAGSDVCMTVLECDIFKKYKDDAKDNGKLNALYEKINQAKDSQSKKQALNNFRDHLYKNYAPDIYALVNRDKQDDKDSAEPIDNRTWAEMSDEFNYYVNLWSAINEAGGCKVVETEYISGEEGNKWLNSMVTSGLVTIQVYDDTGSRGWSDTSVATSTNNNYLQELQNEKDLKKAEAKYEHELDVITRKDTKFDTKLSTLETERTSITTEIESIGKVRDDNIDRTFGIFS